MQGALPTLWLWLAGSAWGQEPPLPPGFPEMPAPVDPAPFEPVPLDAPLPAGKPFALSYQGEWWWVPTGPVIGAILDVASDPERATTMAAITRDGAVWVSLDAGVTWRRSLDPAFDATGSDGRAIDDPLRQIEDALSEINIESEPDYTAYDGNDTLEYAASAIQDIVDEIDAQQSDEGGDGPALGRSAPRSRVWFDAGVLYAGREDGLFVSVDTGSSWLRALDVTTSALTRTARGLVAGTTDGMRYSGDGVLFFDVIDGSEGLDVLALTAAGPDGAVYAGTRQGLWYSADGSAWGQRFAFQDPVFDVVLDPDVPGRLWVALPDTILSSDNLGTSFLEPLTAPMPEVTELVWLGTLHWVAASGDGAWETMNGGLSWVPIVRGLTDPATWDSPRSTVSCSWHRKKV